MKTHTSFYISLALTVLALVLAPVAIGQEGLVTSQMTGKWDGSARIIVSWCKQKNLAVSLDIKPDGTVTGTIGDASLTGGKLKANRGALGRKLNIKTDYIITGKLKGPIVAAEGITRASVKIPVNFSGSTYSGGLHTSGSHGGGKKSMKLSATGLRMTSAADAK